MSDINCPYCDAELDICHDDGYGYEESTLHQMECNICGKVFVFETSISFYYEPYEASCLNEGGEHEWKPTRTFPIQFTKMRCSMCGEERKPTEKEMVFIINENKE